MSAAGTSRGIGAFDEALVLHQQGYLQEAARRYRAILATDRGHIEALGHLGLICLQQGNIEEAMGLFTEALDRDPNSAEAHGNLANAFLAAKRLDEAVTAYRATLAIDPDYAEANSGSPPRSRAWNASTMRSPPTRRRLPSTPTMQRRHTVSAPSCKH